MRRKFLLIIVIAISLFLFPNVNFGQTVNLGAIAQFAVFTKAGAISDNASAHSRITGDVGYEISGAFSGFGNVNGVMSTNADPSTAAAGISLGNIITQLNGMPATLALSSLIGNGATLVPGIYSFGADATVNGILTLDGQNDPTSLFVIKIQGKLDVNANVKLKLINGALACNVFWQIDQAVNMAAGVSMKGNIVAGGAIGMATLDTLEGRALTTVDAITFDGDLVYTPIGCGSPVLTGPPAPDLGSIACYSIFASIGALVNTTPTNITGDVGKDDNGSAISGWLPAYVTGTLHNVRDASTIQGAIDLSNAYSSINALLPDIELLYPAQFGHDLILTPHTYLLNSGGAGGPAALTDSVYLDAQGNPDAVFVFKVTGGELTTSTYARVKLINGAQAKNVYWMVQGKVDINNYSRFNGTIIVPVGAINLLNTGVELNGRALAMNGMITTTGVTATSNCCPTFTVSANATSKTVCAGTSVTLTGSGATSYSWTGGVVDGVSFTPLLTKTYTLTGTKNGSCTNMTTITVVVNTIPTLTVTSNFNTVCAGTTVILTASGATSYSWTGGITNGLGFTPLLTDTYTVTGTTNNCTGSATKMITVNSIPTLTVTSNFNTVCTGTTVILTASGAASYSWTGGVTNGLGFIPLATDTYTVTGTTNNCTGSATKMITVNSIPTLTVTSNFNTVCAGTTVILTASGATSYSWSGGITNGLGFTPLSTNTYTVTGTTNNCSGTATKMITVNSIPTLTVTSNFNTVCTGTTVILTASGATTYSWTGGVTNGLGFIPLATDTYTVTGTTNNCSSTATKKITVNSIPTLTVIASSFTVCAGDFVTLTASGAANYSWSGGITNGLGFAAISPNTYTVTGTTNNCSGTALAVLTVNSLPTAIANSNSPVCMASPLNLTAQIVTGATYKWSGPNAYTSMAKDTVIASPTLSHAGTYSLTVSINGCTSVPSTVAVIVNSCDADFSVVKTVDNTKPFMGRNVVFTIVAKNDGPTDGTGVMVTDVLQNGYEFVSSTATAGSYNANTGDWTIGNMNIGVSQTLTITAKVLETGNYVNTSLIYANETDLNMNNNVSTVETFPTDFFIPEGFSPNEDDINDLFVIRGILNYPNNTFTVFNRWGNVLYKSSSYKNGWNGKSTTGLIVGGDDLPVGTYFYVLDLGDGSAFYKGTIYLNK